MKLKCKSIKKFAHIFSIVVLLYMYAMTDVSAELRNIYVGDIITLEIDTSKIKVSEEELREKFKKFEILELKEENQDYLISIRTFDIGEQRISIGGNEIIITVTSTLDDIASEDIFDGDKYISEQEFSLSFLLAFIVERLNLLSVFFCIATGIFMLSLGIVIFKAVKEKRKKPENNYQRFVRCSESLSIEAAGENYLVNLTLYFKQYLENICRKRIIGKTSTEIIEELRVTDMFEAELFEIGRWLAECDMFKFSGVEVSRDDKRRHCEKLLNLAERIESARAI